MRISELGRGSSSTQKKVRPQPKLMCFSQKKRKKKQFCKEGVQGLFTYYTYLHHVYFKIILLQKCTFFVLEKIFLPRSDIQFTKKSLKKSLNKIKKNVCYFIRNFSCNLIIILLTMLFKFNTDTPKRSPVQPPISAKRDRMV